ENVAPDQQPPRQGAPSAGRCARGSTPSDGSSPNTVPRRSGWMRRLFGACWRHPLVLVLALGAAGTAVGLEALVPLLTRQAVDGAIAGSTAELPWIIGGLIGL